MTMIKDLPAVLQQHIERWFAQDVDGMADTLSDELTLWHNHIGKRFSKTEMLGFLHGTLDVIERLEWQKQRWTIISESKVLLQHEMYVKTHDGRELKNIPNAVVYTIGDHKILSIEEYVDGPALASLGFG